MTAPDRIWANSQEWPKGSGRIEVYAASKPDPDEPSTEYVRADLARAPLAEALAVPEVKALVAILREADSRIAWESVGMGNDFSDRVEAAFRGIGERAE